MLFNALLSLQAFLGNIMRYKYPLHFTSTYEDHLDWIVEVSAAVPHPSAAVPDPAAAAICYSA